MSHTGAAFAAEGYYPSTLHPGMFFKKRTACDSVALDTPRINTAEITTDPFATEGKQLAIDDHQRRHHAFVHGAPNDYFEWRAEQGLEWWGEQERLAANDNHPIQRVAAA